MWNFVRGTLTKVSHWIAAKGQIAVAAPHPLLRARSMKLPIARRWKFAC